LHKRLSPSPSNKEFKKVYNTKLETSVLKTGKGRFNKFKDNHVKMAKFLAAQNIKKRGEVSSLTVSGPNHGLNSSPSNDSVDAMNLPAIEGGSIGLPPVPVNLII
jgi:hypothetical protein